MLKQTVITNKASKLCKQ